MFALTQAVISSLHVGLAFVSLFISFVSALISFVHEVISPETTAISFDHIKTDYLHEVFARM